LELAVPDSAPVCAFVEVVYALELPSARPMWMTGCAFTQPHSIRGLAQRI
jgi:hypothetical protein